MIDKKKIKKAASAYEKKTQIECKKLNEKLNSGNEFSVTYKSADAAFIDGANWAIQEFLKDLWHPTGEKPKKGCVFLYKTIFNGYGLNQIIDGNEWEYIIKYQKATQWLYIDDLLPKKGGGKK